MDKTLDELLQVGNRIIPHHGKPPGRGATLHIRAIVDDMIVTRHWAQVDWQYSIRHRTDFEQFYKDGNLKYAGSEGGK